jgi:hypothetical protein
MDQPSDNGEITDMTFVMELVAHPNDTFHAGLTAHFRETLNT